MYTHTHTHTHRRVRIPLHLHGFIHIVLFMQRIHVVDVYCDIKCTLVVFAFSFEQKHVCMNGALVHVLLGPLLGEGRTRLLINPS